MNKIEEDDNLFFEISRHSEVRFGISSLHTCFDKDFPYRVNLGAKDMAHVDREKGLPLDILAVVARLGGPSLVKAMRGVSTSWQQGYELAVTGITVMDRSCQSKYALLPSGTAATQRLPALAKLNLGKSQVDTAWLANLRAYPSLDCLILGVPYYPTAGTLTYRLANADMQHLLVSACAAIKLSTDSLLLLFLAEILCFASCLA